MSKIKDKAIDEQNATVSDGSPIGMAELLKECEGVIVSDVNRLRVTATDVETLNARTEAVVQKLGEFGNITVSPKYGDAAAIGCVWYDLKVEPKLS
jgi:hypothetical protein